tara:strand:- start:10 stop:381 length:372 start_codon:yes stop_codon:yes gene_type:complete
LSDTPLACFEINPLDAEQAPSGRLEKIKVSVIDKRGEASQSFMVGACTDDIIGTWGNDTITVGATGRGGGTVWLSCKRFIRSSDDEEDRNDGKVTVMLATQDNEVDADIVCEVWGRFIQLSAL